MPIIVSLPGQGRQHIRQRTVAGALAIPPAGYESIPGIPYHREHEVSSRSFRIFAAQHPIVHEMPIRIPGIHSESTHQRHAGALALVDEDAFVVVADHHLTSRRSRLNESTGTLEMRCPVN